MREQRIEHCDWQFFSSYIALLVEIHVPFFFLCSILNAKSPFSADGWQEEIDVIGFFGGLRGRFGMAALYPIAAQMPYCSQTASEMNDVDGGL
jgi:hypothetical protein